jgi:bacterioferritin (cytochrome b1)
VVFEIYFVVPYFEVFEEHNTAFEEHNKALIEVVDRIASVDFDNYYQFVVEHPVQYL